MRHNYAALDCLNRLPMTKYAAVACIDQNQCSGIEMALLMVFWDGWTWGCTDSACALLPDKESGSGREALRHRLSW
jgi:hypothetical protein